MSVYKRGKIYWVAFCFNRHRYRKASPENSYKGAQAYELVLRQKLARGEPFEAVKAIVRPYFQEVALQWLEVLVKNNNKPSEYVNRGYILKADMIPYFGKKRIDEITSFNIEQYKSHCLKVRNLAPKTINNRLCLLSRCFKTALEWGMISEMPKIKLLRVPPQRFDYLTETEAQLLLRHAEGMWYDMILLAIRTGLRFGEIIALRGEDIDLCAGTLTVNRSIVRNVEGSPKNNKTRTVPLTESVLEMLRKRLNGNERIFAGANGMPLQYDVCSRRLQLIYKAAGLRRISWHKFRHSFASHLAAQNISIVAIKELLGHSDIKTTMRYAHVNLPVLQDAIRSLEMNDTIASQSKISQQVPAIIFR